MKSPEYDRIRDYDRIAKLFDQRLSLYARQTIEVALELANLEGTEAVLDACCGTGELLQLIALKGHRGPLLGVDFSGTMINVALRRLRSYPQIVLKNEDVCTLNLPSDYFHLIFNTNAFHYLQDPNQTLQEFKRILRPHGRLILADLAANSRWIRIWSQIRRFIRPSYFHIYRVEEATNLLRKAGFIITRHKYLRINYFWSVMIFEVYRPAEINHRPAKETKSKS